VVMGSNLATGQTGASAALTPESERQVLKLFGSNKPGTLTSITGGSFTLTLVTPSGNTVTTGAITFSNANTTTTAGNIAAQIQTALNVAQLTNAAVQTPVAVTQVGTNSDNPLIFNIDFDRASQAQLNVPKITVNATNALTGALG